MRIFARVTLAIVGGYVGTSAMIAALAALTAGPGGLDRSEAATLGSLMGFVVYPAVIIWSFGEPRLARVALVLAGATAVSVALLIFLPRIPS